MTDIRKRIAEVIENGDLLSLATVDSGGVWVSDLQFISDKDLNLYWMSDPKFRHSKAIGKNNKVACTITIRQKIDLGVQLEGRVEKLKAFEPNLILKYLKKKPFSKKAVNVLMEGYVWYKLKPTFIELIDQGNFGFKKQKLKIN